MPKDRGLLLAGWLILGAALTLWLAGIYAHREPEYQGRPLTRWLEQYSTNAWPLDKDAENAIRTIGTNGTRTLFNLVTTKESSSVKWLLSSIPSTKMFPHHLAMDYHYKIEARRRLGANGFMALKEIAGPAVPQLIALLKDKDTDIRYLSVFALRCLGPVAKDALPDLIECLDDPEFTIRDDAVAAMGTIHEKPEVVIPILTNFIQKWHSRSILCTDATIAVGKFGADAKTAIPILKTLLDDKELSIRTAATNALKDIDLALTAKTDAK